MYNEVYKNSKVRKFYNQIYDWAKSLPENVIVKKKNEAEKIIKAENEKNLQGQKKTTKALSPNETKTKSKKKDNKAPVKKKAKKVSKK